MDRLIFNEFKLYIRNNILTSLNQNEFDELMNYLMITINYIINKIVINNFNLDIFINQLKQNNYRDLIAIFNLLLPLINDDNGSYIYHKMIYNISDISTLKNKNGDYSISKIQYDRCYIYNDNDNLTTEEYKYTMNDINNNHLLLLDTLDVISNKLYVNWVDVLPLKYNEYKNSMLYKNSFKWNDVNKTFIDNKNLSIDEYINDFNNNRFKYNGLDFSDYYQVIYHDLYLSIYPIKWIIYDLFDFDEKRPKSYIEIINKFINLKFINDNPNWDLLTENEINNFKIKLDQMNDELLYDGYKNRIITNIVLFLERDAQFLKILEENHNYISITKSIKLSINIDDDIDNDYDNLSSDKYKQMLLESVKKQIKNIPHNIFYAYFADVLNKLNKTWYGKKIIKENNPPNDRYIIASNVPQYDNSNIASKFTYDDKIVILFISFKNIYNFAKKLCVYYPNKKNEREIFSRGYLYPNYLGINNDFLKKFIEKLKHVKKISYKKYISNIFNNTELINKDFRNAIKNLDDKFYVYIMNNICNIVFETLIYKGLLTEYKSNSLLSNIKHKNQYYELFESFARIKSTPIFQFETYISQLNTFPFRINIFYLSADHMLNNFAFFNFAFSGIN